MKGGTLQITWHGSDPVLTLDFHSLSGLLATGGADHDIKFWHVHDAQNGPLPSATFHSCLSYHTAAVNVVRFSASGDQLASGADGGEILVWRLTENPEASCMWKLAKNLRFHVKDVLDLQWSSDGAFIISGSVDNTVIIWDIAKGNPQQVLKDHMHYVQGVAWDPTGQYIASISGDRTCRIYNSKPQNSKGKSQDKHNFSCQSVLVKAEVPKQEDDAERVPATKLNLFHDETLPSFFRRLAWSPDGSFLLVPAGIHKFPSEPVSINTAFIISRKDLSRPAVQLPGASKPVVAVRFCPLIFSCYSHNEQKTDNDSKDAGIFKLPYRLVFAVATLNSLYVYDTQSAHPLAVLAGIHYAAITDIAWSHDGKFLAVSSQDGFCTLAMFEKEELGSPLPLDEVPSHVAKFLASGKDSMEVINARLHETATKAKSKEGCDSFSAKKDDNQSSSVLNMEAARSDREEQAQAIAVPEKEDERTISDPELPRQEVVLDNKLHLGSHNADDKLGCANNENAPVVETVGNKDGQKKPRRIVPIAITNGLLEPVDGASASLTNIATPVQLCQEVNVSSENSPKRPRRITPVAVLGASEDHETSTLCVNSGTPPHQTQPQIVLHEESHARCEDAVNGSGHMESGPSNGREKQADPKKPRRITPVLITANCNTPQIDEERRDGMN